MMNQIMRLVPCLLLVCTVVAPAPGQEFFDERYSDWPENLKINGQVIINHGLEEFESSRSYLRRITRGRQVVCFKDAESESKLIEELKSLAGDGTQFSIVESRRLPVELTKSALASADVVVMDDSMGSSEAVTGLTTELSAFVDRGGVLIADASWADCLGDCYRLASRDSDAPTEFVAGMKLLPDCYLQCLDEASPDAAEGMLNHLPSDSATVGVLLEPSTLLVCAGRKMFCFGEGKATFCLPACDHSTARIESIVERRSRSQAPWDALVDLTEWRRDAIDRTLEPFPPANPRTPNVENGTLLIVGGGGSPRGLMSRFVELAGGVENARLVYVPCSEADDVGDRQRTVDQWREMGVKNATFIHTKDRRKADKDDSFLEPLKDATGIWFGGGRQWNFADSYYGTTAHKRMKEVLERGGVIGGSSAGASIQARYLARATPIGNTRIMAPGYERGGLGFIGGVAIDQHFTQRGRQKDMTGLMARHPQLLGIGLDEATAIEVSKSQAKVSGRGRVFFYNRELPVIEGQPDYVALPAGSIYDLAKREVILDTTPKDDADSDETDSKEVGEQGDGEI